MPEFEPAILTHNLDEETYDEYINVWEDRYGERQSIEFGPNFGVPNAHHNLGGGLENFTRGGYRVKYQGPEGYFYSLQPDEYIYERINRDFSVDWQVEVGHRMGEGNFSAFGVIEDYVVTADSIAAESGRAEVQLLDRETGESEFSAIIPYDVAGFAYDPERRFVYFASGGQGDSEQITAIALDGTVGDEPQVDFEYSLSADRNWLNEGYEQDVFFYDGDLYVYTKGRVYVLNKRTGKVIEFKEVFTESNVDLDVNVYTDDEDVQVDQNGNLHLLNRTGQSFLDRKNYYLVYDLDEEEVLKERYFGNGFESLQPNADDGTAGYEGSDTIGRDGYVEFKEVWPAVINEDKLDSLGVTPWGYIIGIESDALPRYEMYDHATDTLQWTMHLGERRRYGDGTLSGRNILFEQAYPPLSHQPRKWDDEMPDPPRYANSNEPPKSLTTALSTGSFTEGSIVAAYSQENTVTTNLNVTTSFAEAAATIEPEEPLVGILGGGESIDGGPPADEMNSLYTYTDSTLIEPDISILDTGTGGTWNIPSQDNLVTATITQTDQQAFLATVANSSDNYVAADTVPNISTTAVATDDRRPIRVSVNVLQDGVENYWRQRVVGVGETTDAGISPE